MRNRRYALIVLASTILVASVLACGPQEPTTGPQQPPPTVTPYVPVTSPPQPTPQQTPQQLPTDTPTEAVASPEPPAATDTPPPPTPTTRPAPTATPKPPVSEGPLDFEEPRWVHAWRPREGGVWVTVKVIIHGGAPPFSVYHDGNYDGQIDGREYLLEFPAAGCGQIVHTITVKSADAQEVTKDYWLGKDLLPWCD